MRHWLTSILGLLVLAPCVDAVAAQSSAERQRPSVSEGLDAAIRAAAREEHYHAIWQVGTPLANEPAAWQAPNRAQGYRTYFGRGRIEVHPRLASMGDWSWGLTLETWGRGDHQADAVASDPEVDGRRVQYRRPGLVEWYVNESDGLEQGFDIQAPPATPSGGPLVLVLRQSGSLRAERVSKTRLALSPSAGSALLRFDALHAFDSRGHPLDARFVVHGDTIRIEVDDEGARYPITVDPVLASEEAKLVGGEPEAAFEQPHVDVDGTTAVVSDLFPGAFVFERLGSNWHVQARIFVPPYEFENFWAHRVAISGDVIAIESRNLPAVFIYRRTGTRWNLEQTLPESTVGNVLSVALDGSTLVVGGLRIPGYQGSDEGRAAVFDYDGAAWTLTTELQLSDQSHLCGWSVDIEGDTLVVGCPREDALATEAGAAYVYRRVAGVWGLDQQLTAYDGAANDHFGASVVISGDTVAVGAPSFLHWLATIPGEQAAGRAYVYQESGATWLIQQRIDPSISHASDAFGTSIDLEGDVLLVGASFSGSPEPPNGVGRAFVFERTAGSWSETQLLSSPSTLLFTDYPDEEGFGYKVALDGPHAFVTAKYHDAVFSYRRTGSTLAFDQEIAGVNRLPNDHFAEAVSIAGDTAVVGAPFDGVEASTAGAASVFVRSGKTWSLQARLRDPAGAAGDQFGASVAVEGDTVVVGAPMKDALGLDAGAVFLFERTGSVWGAPIPVIDVGGAALDHFGAAVDIEGDLLAIGAPGDDHAGGVDAGSVTIYARQPDDSWVGYKRTDASAGAGDAFGTAVAVDGTSVLVGAPFDDEIHADQGSAVRLFGPNHLSQLKLVAGDASADQRFGTSVALQGGTAVIGAPRDDQAGTHAGAVYVQGGFVFDTQWKLLASDGAAGDELGTAVALDGSRLLAGAWQSSGAATQAGAAYLFEQSGGTWQETQVLHASDAGSFDGFGRALDLDGDSALIGAPQTWLAPNDLGAAYVLRLDPDCDDDGTPDAEEPDADGDGVPDDCDVCPIGDDTLDCDGNQVPDACDLDAGTHPDCNANAVPDTCDLGGASLDWDFNGVPDECDIAGWRRGALLQLVTDDGDTSSQVDDTSGSGNHGVNQDVGFDLDVPFPFPGNRSLSFATGTAAIIVDASPATNLNQFTALTLEAHVKANDTGSLHFIQWADDGPFQLFINANRLYFGLDGSSGSVTISTPFTTTGSWAHVAATWDGATARLYVNGAEVQAGLAAVGTVTVSPVRNVIHIGNDETATCCVGFNRDFDGLIDEAMIYDRALTLAEVVYDAEHSFQPGNGTDCNSNGLLDVGELDTDADGDIDDCDDDDDGDGLADVVETGTGIFVDANDTGTDPLLADSDGDGIDDGAEVAGGSDPTDANDPIASVPGVGAYGRWLLLALVAGVGAWRAGTSRGGARWT